ncbi:MAG: hypothetical protein ACLGH0_01035 [Thermoanaerobaculia bacterium]
MSSEPLQFERAEFADDATPSHLSCVSCNSDIVQSYYEFAGSILCANCREARERAHDGLGLGRFLRATLAGIGAGIAGAALWYGVRVATGYEVGLISIAIGFGVGKAVNWGSRGKGGWLYQLLALFLTYSSIVANYVPEIVEGFTGGAPATPLAYVAGFIVSYAAPFLMGFENIIGLLIIAFGLFEAWKLNRRVDAQITGPYSVTPAAPVTAPVPNV